MYNCQCENNNVGGHVNAFVDLNGIPYLLAEYLDRNAFQQIDRSQIKSEIIVDQSEAMRAIVDISVDDIGKRSSDGYPAITGNTTKYHNLLNMISNSCELMNHQFNVLRRGIVIRVDYQLENYRTGQVIRSTSEEFKILDRSYFLDINPRNTDDNGIIVNFCNTMVSTINEFTHGQDPMMIRVTNVHMSYEMVKQSPKVPRIKQSLMGSATAGYLPTNYGMENEMYKYHSMMQNRHVMPGYDPTAHVNEDPNMILPTSWTGFNRFYRFDNGAQDIIIHDQEINDPMTKVILIPCGTVRVNRTFIINPGHRIIFKFCIWKNDATIVNDTTKIAQQLRVPVLNNPSHNDSCNHHAHQNGCTGNNDHGNHLIDIDYESLIRMINVSNNMIYRQNQVINQLTDKVAELTTIVQTLVPPVVENPDTGTGDEVECPTCDTAHEELEEKIEDINKDVSELQDAVDEIPDVVPISSDTIKEIVAENSQPLEL